MKKLSILVIGLFVCASAFAYQGKHPKKHHDMRHAEQNCEEQGLKPGSKEFKDCMAAKHEKTKEHKEAHRSKHEEHEQTDK